MLLEIILHWTIRIISCNIVITLCFWEKKQHCVMIWLICDFLPFYAHVHTCSPSYTDEELKKDVDSETVCLRLLIKGLIVPIRLCLRSLAYY